ncbi:MAG: carboxypeptidase-like regulatory domain-containing protein [Chitinophagales bacterium]|nr:carboxypeptidase-like regulatory domain-containing protein [Chitinophagales bacterium]
MFVCTPVIINKPLHQVFSHRVKFSVLLLILLICFSVTFSVRAQTGIVKGRVTESGTSQPVELANVMIENTDRGAVTNERGEFIIEQLMPGLVNIRISCVGYKPKTVYEIEITNGKPQNLNIELEPASQELSTVEITASPFTKNEESPLSVRTIGTNEIQRYPGGNRDISRVIQSLPGVGFTASFRNDILIRGGGPSENRFYLDGIEIPNINHFATQGAGGGPVGLINVDFIREVNFYSGAFPANRGNTLSSVMDIRMKDGRDDRWGGTLTLGSSEFAASMETPLNKKKSATLIASVRHSYLQFLFQALKLPFLPTYTDAQFKVKWKITPKDELTVISLGALDQFKLNLKANETENQRYLLGVLPEQGQWNYTIGAKYVHLFNNSYLQVVISRNMLNNFFYKHPNNNRSLPRNFDYSSLESENKLRIEHTGRFRNWKYNYGINYEYARYYNRSEFRTPVTGDTITIPVNFESTLALHKYGLFGQLSRSLAKDRLLLSFGMRIDGNTYNRSMRSLANQLSPRISLSYAITEALKININGGYYHQLPPYTLLGYRNPANELVNRNRITYMRNAHAVAGIEYAFKWNARISAEGFYKHYFNIPFLLNDSVSLANLGGNFGVVGNEPGASTSKGRSYGVELLYEQKLYKGWFGIIAYTLFWSQFEDIRKKDYAPSAWDTRHIISLTGGKKFKKNWETGARWRIAGGAPYTPFDIAASTSLYAWPYNRAGVLDYRRLNSERLDWFHQLDIRITKRWYFKKWSFELYLDVQNLYGFAPDQTPNLIVKTDANDSPVPDENRPGFAQYSLTKTRNRSIIPTLGFVVYY